MLKDFSRPVTPRSPDSKKLAFLRHVVEQTGGIHGLQGVWLRLEFPPSRPRVLPDPRLPTGKVKGKIVYNHGKTVVVQEKNGQKRSFSVRDLVEGLCPNRKAWKQLAEEAAEE